MFNTQTTVEGHTGYPTQAPHMQMHMHWVEVRDERGRTHMEARWSSDAPTGLHAPHAA